MIQELNTFKTLNTNDNFLEVVIIFILGRVNLLKKQPFCNFTLAGVSITDFGLKVPSPFASLELSNSEIQSMTSWTLNCTVTGDASKSINIAAFEALLYSSAQAASQYSNSSGIPVSFVF